MTQIVLDKDYLLVSTTKNNDSLINDNHSNFELCTNFTIVKEDLNFDISNIFNYSNCFLKSILLKESYK